MGFNLFCLISCNASGRKELIKSTVPRTTARIKKIVRVTALKLKKGDPSIVYWKM